MNGLPLEELIRIFVSLEEDTDAITVLSDDDAMSVLAAWRKTDQSWKAPKAKMPVLTAQNHSRVWSWLREGWTIDAESIQRATGLSSFIVRTKLAMLLAARLIYPDGRIAKAATMALKLHVAKRLGVKPKLKKDPVGDPGDGKMPTN